MLMFTTIFSYQRHMSGGKGHVPPLSPPPPLWQNFKKAGFLVYSGIFVIFIWNYHYSTQLNRTKGRN